MNIFKINLLFPSMTGKDRMTSEECRNRDMMNEEIWQELRQASEAHRQTRMHMQQYIKPGMTMIEIWLENINLIYMCFC